MNRDGVGVGFGGVVMGHNIRWILEYVLGANMAVKLQHIIQLFCSQLPHVSFSNCLRAVESTRDEV